MTREQTFEKLHSLKLHGLSQALERQLGEPAMAELAFEERVAMLVDAQWQWRENRALERRLRQARLKKPASLEDVDYRHPRRLERSVMRSLAGCDWVRRRRNIAVTGPSGVGKTYLCCALVEKACREGFTGLYFSAPKLFRQLGAAWADGSFDRLLTRLARTDVLAIDDWGVAPPADQERRHFLEVLDDRSETRSTILTSQFPISSWHDLIGQPTLADAIVERILSNCHRIELQGESIRPLGEPAPEPEAS